MAAYVVVQVNVKDAAKFEEYRKQGPATIAQYGGRYVVRGGAMEEIEGKWAHPRLVILEFPTMDQAKAWYHSPEYAGPKALRFAAADANAVFVEGV